MGAEGSLEQVEECGEWGLRKCSHKPQQVLGEAWLLREPGARARGGWGGGFMGGEGKGGWSLGRGAGEKASPQWEASEEEKGRGGGGGGQPGLELCGWNDARGTI